MSSGAKAPFRLRAESARLKPYPPELRFGFGSESIVARTGWRWKGGSMGETAAPPALWLSPLAYPALVGWAL